MTEYDPFGVLGLPARADLTDDEVRAAWRRIAAATHPDLPDGGDPPRYAAAAAAYATLRTPYGRGEAYADLTGPRARPPRARPPRPSGPVPSGPVPSDPVPSDPVPSGPVPSGPVPPADGARTAARRLAWRVLSGRPVRLLVRIGLAAGVSLTCAAVAGWQPATVAITVGCLTWLVRTTRYDLAHATT